MFRHDVRIAGWGHGRRAGWACGLVLAWLTATGCASVEKLAINQVANAFSGGGDGDVFASDSDPELVRDALPFGLKVFEALLAKTPENVGLLLTTCQGFTSYSYAFVELEAEYVELDSFREAERMRDRALKLFLRGRDYCFQALEVLYPGMVDDLRREVPGALDRVTAADVELLYWTAGAWGSAISLALDQPELVVDLATVRGIFDRTLELDPEWQRGALYDAMLILDALPASAGGSLERAKVDFDKALELNGGHRVSTYLSWAIYVSLPGQDRAEFEEMIDKALAVDLDKVPSERLANTVQQRYARFLLEQIDDLFI